ncbi:xylanase [Tamlana sp. 62-3]|uniref:Xylanase n=1 Tax=Neotamlana sargassicola TaxID=2883125 RepID=A0A9X1I7R9_9FLAO|nr:glycoside hydrolase [Tamlana sargassicola]MCB4807879.1 xylanase [Tamlana sargassicola]
MIKFFCSTCIIISVFSIGMAQENALSLLDSNRLERSGSNHLVKVEIDASQTYQTIHNFGASDAWSIQFVGKNWPESSKKQIADLLFSRALKKDGSPKGIGLSAWRFNIGAGSMEQGEASDIKNQWRRTESFLDSVGNYNWNAQSGQVWFLKQAQKMGVNNFVGFVNSPPVHLTKNNKAFSQDGLSANIGSENYSKYAQFLVKVIQGIKENAGVKLNYVSPFNEPQWKWKCCNQEGSPWNNDEIATMTKILNDSLSKQGLETKIELTEAGQIDYLFSDFKDENRGDQINVFFNPSSKNYLGNLSHVAKKVVGHSYFSTWPTDRLVRTRKLLAQKIEETNSNLEYGMSEYTLLENNEEVKGKGRDLEMAPALYMARVLHADLTIANATFWHWWLAVSPYNYKDGLIYIDKKKDGGEIFESKLLWTLGHYSRFIEPGMIRIGTDYASDVPEHEKINGLLCSAYQSKSGNKIVLVFTNQLNEDKIIQLSGVSKQFEKMKLYITSESPHDNLRFIGEYSKNQTVSLPKRSLITCVFETN